MAASLNAAVLTSCYDTVLYAPCAKNEMPRNPGARQREITLCVTVRSETWAPQKRQAGRKRTMSQVA